MTKYFLDTYAIMEIIMNSKNYEPYIDVPAFTCVFNLAELNLALKKQIPEKRADEYLELASEMSVKVLNQDIINGMNLKMKNRKMSIPDVIGYSVAKRLGAKFLTGDKEFEGMENVEFVK